MGGLLLYYTLGSDPALWPAGERRERGLIMHDKGYYHSLSRPLSPVAQGHGRRRGDGNEEAAGLRDGDFRSVATFKKRQESDWSGRPGAVSCSHPEQLVDELNLSPNIRTAHPPRLPLPDHVYCLVSLDRSPCRVKFTKALLGLHSSFDRSMILLQDVVQVSDRPVAAAASQDSFLFHS